MFMIKQSAQKKFAVRMSGLKLQAGMTLVEAMISLALSLIVTSAMVVLMGNSLGTTTRIVKMSQLSDELRNTMSMLTRDVRRANYSANATYCYANADCGLDGSANQFADLSIGGVGNDCFVYGLDRDFDGDASTDDAGGFRFQTTGGVGRIEMWIGDASPVCNSGSSDWVALTDPDFVNITAFTLDVSGSFNESVTGAGGSTITQFTRQLGVQLVGELIIDNTITRTIEDVIKLRNDVITKT